MCDEGVPVLVDGGWSTWSSWNQCSKSCGLAGMRTRERTCCCPKPQYGGKECIGNTAQSKDCFPTECPRQPMFYMLKLLVVFICKSL